MNHEMDMLARIYFGNTVLEWLTSLGLALLCLAGLVILKAIIVKRLGAFAAQTSTDVDDLVVEMLKRTKSFFLIILSLFASSLTLDLSPAIVLIVRKVAVLALLGQVVVWGTNVIEYLVRKTSKRRKDEDPSSATTLVALGFFGRLVLWSVVLLLALDNLGVNITTLIAGLGVGGIAVALAVQSMLGDVLASLSIVLDKPFVIGDFIVVEAYLGAVEYIGLRTTRIRSLSGEQIIFSNADLLRCRIRNYKRMNERRIVFTFGVKYETPHDKLARIGSMVRDIIASKTDIRFDRAHFKEFGNSALNYEVAYYVLSPDYNLYMDLQQEINLELCKKFEEEGIEFAYPTHTVHIVPAPKETPSISLNDGER
ncbi:MAG TPA: mechanosensitive ion channel family protein [Bacteroidota bacterium]|nr:mechanosensitive ion channel family protein [Bacteroidota bacterium]